MDFRAPDGTGGARAVPEGGATKPMSTAYKSLVLVIACVATILALLFASAPPDTPRNEPEAGAPSTDAPRSAPAPGAEAAINETGGPAMPALATPVPAAPSPTSPPPTNPAPAEAGKFYFDVIGHSPDEFHALLERANTIFEATPEDERQSLEVVLVLHGPDIEFFATSNYGEYRDIVDLAAKLDALDVFDFRMCAASAASLGLDEGDVPAFIEFVPYGPTEIRRLEDAGFVQL